jgi:hypothetical protein
MIVYASFLRCHTPSYVERVYEIINLSGVKIQKYPAVAPRDRSNLPKTKTNTYCPGLFGIHKIIFLEKKRLYVVATRQLQMRVLDVQFDELSLYSNPLPILRFDRLT